MEDLLIQKFSNKCLLRYLDLPESIDAVSEYDPISNLCVVVVNMKKCTSYLRRRLNFSLAHELGYYVLEHHQYFKDNLTFGRVQELEEEANEFAGLFLVNEYKLMKNRMVKSAFWSDYFFVSQEVVRIRKERIGIHTRYI